MFYVVATTVGSITENKDDGITWIFYIAAFCAVVIVLMLVMMMILALKHFQLCREMDKSKLLFHAVFFIIYLDYTSAHLEVY